ncbi:MAG: ABC transporter substrate-binding protein [Geminicoccaceae bacterium]|nr:MAG: ABC transporter substrate-binding protein [Geminicoccaceae bacterium]
MRPIATPLVAGALALGLAASAAAETTLRVVMHSDLLIIDPIWTTAYITRNHGYLVYDTLLATDAEGNVRPQMADGWTVSDDGLVYTFTLRDGLVFHDGEPVTGADVAASIERWGRRDAMGQKLMSFVEELRAPDDMTFELVLREPYGLVELSLAKPSSNVPFIMPARIAATPADQQIEEPIGSGPFVFDQAAWEPGNRVVYRRFEDYVPRDEPPSWAAGGKVANVDVVEWVSMPDAQTALNALITGEIDIVEQIAHDLLPLVEFEDDIDVININPLGNQYMFRMNWLHAPFDDQLVRQAAIAALNQRAFLEAVIGNPDFFLECAAMFGCDTPFATDVGAEITLVSDFERSRALLAEAGYDGTPVVLMHSTDLQVLTNLAPVAAQLLRQGGFTVDMQSMDWQTLVSRRARKDAPAEGGWNAFMTSWVAADIMNPIAAAGFTATGENAWFGWPEDEELEAMRNAFATETDFERQRDIAFAIQERALEIGTHMHAGQYFVPMGIRADRVSGVLEGPAPFFWNVTKSGG